MQRAWSALESAEQVLTTGPGIPSPEVEIWGKMERCPENGWEGVFFETQQLDCPGFLPGILDDLDGE